MSNIFNYKVAGAVSLIILTMVGLSAGGLYAKHVYDSLSTQKSMQGQIQTEVEIAMQKAIVYGINDFLLSGFSRNNDVWYCNYPYSVNVNEANESIHYFIKNRVDLYLDALDDRGYNVTLPDIVVPDVEVFNDLDEGKVVVKIENLIVGMNTEELVQLYDLSNDYEVEWPIWELYKGMKNWIDDNGGDILDNIYTDVFMNKSCQILHSACNCSEGDALMSQGLRDSIKLQLNDVFLALEHTVDGLNEQFNESTINCSYKIEKYHIENVEKFNYSTSQTSYLNKNNDVLEWNETRYDYKFQGWVDDFSLPGPGLDGKDALGGCPTWNDSIDSTYRDYVEYNTSIFEAIYESDDSEICTQGHFVRMHNEEFALDKKLGLLVKFSCEDPTLSVENDDGIEPLKAQIFSHISVQLNCPTPNFEDVDNQVDENGRTYACPGGSCFPAGTMISMADGSKKAIENVKVNDFVLSYDPYLNEFIEAQVVELESPFREGIYEILFVDGTSVEVTNEHPFYVKKKTGEIGWASIVPEKTYEETKNIEVMELKIGDSVFKENSEWVEIYSIEYFDGGIQTYNLKDVNQENTFFADGNLVHNKCCFPAGTLIDMADGSTKVIENVEIGDEVFSYNIKTGKKESTKVLELEKPIREGLYVLIFEDGRELRLTNDHPLYTMKMNGEVGWAAVEAEASYRQYKMDSILELEIGDSVFYNGLDFLKVIDIYYEAGDVQTYTLRNVEKNKNFFANGFLAHNKVIGYIGPVCLDEIICETCEGCIVDEDGNSDCVPEAPNTECPGVCTVCDGAGNCNMPALRGTPCTIPEEGKIDCYICDGVNIGNAGCSLFDPPEAATFDCSVQCKRCAGDGSGCTMNPDEDGEQDDCPDCQTCGTDGSCIAEIGQKCGECLACSANGSCEDVLIGYDDCGDACERCLPDGSCGIDLTFGGIDNDCSRCQKCGLSGCEEDPSMNGVSCSSCKTCNGGSCSGNKEDGTLCKTQSNGCQKACLAGRCSIGLNVGAVCDGGYECSTSHCDELGRCSVDVEMTGRKCCGDILCDAGDPCCPYGGWSCESCDDTTT